jgi:hypothetical protein
MTDRKDRSMRFIDPRYLITPTVSAGTPFRKGASNNFYMIWLETVHPTRDQGDEDDGDEKRRIARDKERWPMLEIKIIKNRTPNFSLEFDQAAYMKMFRPVGIDPELVPAHLAAVAAKDRIG